MYNDPSTHDDGGLPPRSRPQRLRERALLTALAGAHSGLPLREIATNFHGADRVAPEWTSDGWMRAHSRRLVNRALTLMERGNTAFPPTRLPQPLHGRS